MEYPNWFSMTAEPFFEKHLTPLAGKPDLHFLQVGAFTGDASLWLLDSVLTGDRSVLVDVDTWGGSDERAHKRFDWTDVEAVYDERTLDARADGRLQKRRCTSSDYFAIALALPQISFDFVYVDGGHTAFDVLNDGVSAYQMLKLDGLLAFDDYVWESGKGDPHDPKLAVDAIEAVYQGRLEMVDLGAQAWFRKIA